MPTAASLVLRSKAENPAHLRQTDLAPHLEAPKSRRNPGKFHSAVRDLVSTTETPIGQTSWSKVLVRHGTAFDQI
jgi:hypothetical protein